MSPETCCLDITTSEVKTSFWSNDLQTKARQTKRNHRSAAKLAKTLRARVVVEKRPSFLLKQIGRIVLVTPVFVAIILPDGTEGCKIKVIEVYRAGCLSINNACIVLSEGRRVEARFHSATHIRFEFEKECIHHHPYTTDIKTLATQCLEPGFILWTWEKSAEQFTTLLQNTTTGKFYCTSPGCNASFRSVSEWKQHYDTFIPDPSHPRRVIIYGDGILLEAGSFLPCLDSIPHIVQVISRHGWQYKSLTDLVTGAKRRQILVRKLTQVACLPSQHP